MPASVAVSDLIFVSLGKKNSSHRLSPHAKWDQHFCLNWIISSYNKSKTISLTVSFHWVVKLDWLIQYWQILRSWATPLAFYHVRRRALLQESCQIPHCPASPAGYLNPSSDGESSISWIPYWIHLLIIPPSRAALELLWRHLRYTHLSFTKKCSLPHSILEKSPETMILYLPGTLPLVSTNLFWSKPP